jgi:uncharacterized Zn finger protein
MLTDKPAVHNCSNTITTLHAECVYYILTEETNCNPFFIFIIIIIK